MKHENPTRIRAFTLIELLIVVAIIAILAAIAVPNFLEAQTRAKISRVKADLRTIDTGLQQYNLDHGQFVYSNINSWTLSLGLSANNMRPTLERLTSPIAYLTGESTFSDPFRGKEQLFGPQLGQTQAIPLGPDGTTKGTQIYRYIARGQNDTMIWGQNNGTQKVVWFMLESCGPDGKYHRMGNALNVADSPARRAWMSNKVLYDASNGTVSNGSVWRAGGKGGRGDYFSDLVQSTY